MKSTISPAPRPPSITSTIPSRPRKPAYTARSTCWAWRSERKRKFFRHPRAKSMATPDRKSTRLNSSHGYISYAVFCLKKKKKEYNKKNKNKHVLKSSQRSRDQHEL